MIRVITYWKGNYEQAYYDFADIKSSCGWHGLTTYLDKLAEQEGIRLWTHIDRDGSERYMITPKDALKLLKVCQQQLTGKLRDKHGSKVFDTIIYITPLSC